MKSDSFGNPSVSPTRENFSPRGNQFSSAPSFANGNNLRRNMSHIYENQLDVTHHLKSVSINFTPHVTCLYSFKNQLFVGLQCGSINKYLVEENDLKFVHQYPNQNYSISALYFSEKYNHLYCGTTNGSFAFFSSISSDLNRNEVVLNKKEFITCFESSTTILFIGLNTGLILRFGLMSNKIFNSFKCLNEPIIKLKLINDLTEQNRIIVCTKNEISIRNSVNGSLLQTLENNGMRSEFIGLELCSNKIIAITNIKDENFHRFYAYDECVSLKS
jgi:hypothetical protein